MAIGRRGSLSRVPSAEEWSMLYGLALKQEVGGVCFFGVQQLSEEQKACLPASLKMRWLAFATQIQTRNELMNRRCVEVQRMLAEEGFMSAILKGQGVAELQGSGDRGSGDRYLNHLNTIKKWHVKQERIQIAESITPTAYLMNSSPTRDLSTCPLTLSGKVMLILVKYFI